MPCIDFSHLPLCRLQTASLEKNFDNFVPPKWCVPSIPFGTGKHSRDNGHCRVPPRLFLRPSSIMCWAIVDGRKARYSSFSFSGPLQLVLGLEPERRRTTEADFPNSSSFHGLIERSERHVLPHCKSNSSPLVLRPL